ncbi:MAG: endonuclease/exonuclease/phosphatase family protein [Pseudomonadota bacterium]
MRLRVCSFNIENLFTRFVFDAFFDERAATYLPPVVQFLGTFGNGDLTRFDDFKRLVEAATVAQDDDHRQHTALAFAAADADVYCLQEVDSIDALRRFMAAYVTKIGVDPYPNLILQEGNDRRGIDVAVVSRDIRPAYARSHADLTLGDIRRSDRVQALLAAHPPAQRKADGFRERIFRRDCLETEVIVGDTRVTLFNCHFKSQGGRSRNKVGMRQLEAIAVREIIARKFDTPETALWAVCGDLNSHRGDLKVRADGTEDFRPEQTDRDSSSDGDVSGLDPLVADGFGENLVNRLPETERWTHYFARDKTKSQLDYIIASPALAEKMRGQPEIIRNGMPFRVPNVTADRYPRVGWDRPKASDHCPVLVEFDI